MNIRPRQNFKFCILEQIIATVLFICISSINNKRSLLRFQSTTAPTKRGWSACGCKCRCLNDYTELYLVTVEASIITIRTSAWEATITYHLVELIAYRILNVQKLDKGERGRLKLPVSPSFPR